MAHGGDVIQELTADHREVDALFEQIEALPATDPQRRELADRLYEWTRAFHGGDDPEVQEFWAEFEDAAAEAAHRAEGASIVAGMRAVFDEAEGPVYPADIRYGRPSDAP